MKEIKSIDRSFQNHKNEVIETDVPTSGDNLSYRNHLGGLILGRLYPQSIQHLMPNEKISGNNEASITFEQISTPLIDDVDVCVHNFLVTLRSIDNRFEKFMTPTKLNNMNSGVTVPMFSLSSILLAVINFINSFMTLGVDSDNNTTLLVDISNWPYSSWDYVYHSDSLIDLHDQLIPLMGQEIKVFNMANMDEVVAAGNIFITIFEFFVGKRSLLDYLGYLMISKEKLVEAFGLQGVYFSHIDHYNNDSVKNWLLNNDAIGFSETFLLEYDAGDDTYTGIKQYIPQCEYALRAYYAIWFEYYRNYDLEPRSTTLPEYRDFGGTSIFGDYSFKYLFYLIPRIRSWQQDAFTTAGIDDISRHVFAPLLKNAAFVSELDPSSDLMPSTVLGNKVVNQTIQWRNPSTGIVSSIDVPVPSRLVSLLQSPSTPMINDVGLELMSLRKSQMLENYLKRIYYGGDEYRDRMLHLYGSRIEDYRINRPQWLSSSIDSMTPRQEVANTGVSPEDDDPMKASIGSRYATATAVQSGDDGFTEFCPEFGIYISMLSIMPHATYDPLLLQNIQSKYTDFPIPQFANQMEDVISTLEISRNSAHTAFGYAPYAHAYRYRVDEVHGDYHDDKYDYVFLRFYNQENIPNLSWSFIHCRPKLPMFVNTILLDGQVYGTFKHNFLVEHPLPSPVETI